MIPVPAAARDYVDLLGVDDTVRLIEAFGGITLTVPVKGSAAWQKLAQRVGAELAHKLSDCFGTDALTVPLCKEWLMRLYAAQGLTHDAIARRLNVSSRTVRRTLSVRANTERQHTFAF